MMETKLFNLAALVIVALSANVCVEGTFSCYSSLSATGQETGCNACQKSVTTVPYVSTVVVTSCTGSCTAVSAGFGGVGEAVYCCYTNLCNGASGMSPNILVGLITSVVSLLFLSR